MKQNMPDISYERSMNHNYMILSKCDFFSKESSKSDDYRTRMILENRIPGLLPVTHRLINGESRYYYEINSLQSLDRLYDKNEIRYNELRRLLSGCVNLFDGLEEYLLDGTQIIIKPELIYINVEKMEPYFVCYPDYEGDVRLSFMEFIDELLTKIDHTDEHAVMLGYQVYRYTRNPNYVISEISHMMGMRSDEETSIAQSCLITNNDLKNSSNNAHAAEAIKLLESENKSCFSPCISAHEDYDEDMETSDSGAAKKQSRKVGDFIGGVVCVLVALCAGAIILGSKSIKTIRLGADEELYLYGAIAMAVVAAFLFFSSYIKKRKQYKEIESLQGQDEDNEADMSQSFANMDNYNIKNYSTSNKIDIQNTFYESSSIKNNNLRPKLCADTVSLGDSIVEERMLCGRMNGREINISLKNLPMTVGKLADVSDFVINDTAVSKMHARFEEHEGKVYVCDLNSTNGTVRNGVLLGVNQSVALEPGDKIRFGRTSFTYC